MLRLVPQRVINRLQPLPKKREINSENTYSHATPQRLEDQRQYIARYEDSRIGEGLNARIFGPKCYHDPAQGQIDACREKSRSDSQTADLHQETVLESCLANRVPQSWMAACVPR